MTCFTTCQTATPSSSSYQSREILHMSAWVCVLRASSRSFVKSLRHVHVIREHKYRCITDPVSFSSFLDSPSRCKTNWHPQTTTVPRPRCCAMLSRRHNRRRLWPLSVHDSTFVPNLSRERGTGCPEPTKNCRKHKTNGSGWSRSWGMANSDASSGGFRTAHTGEWSRGRSLANAEVCDRVEPDCSGARCIVPRIATEPCTQGQVVGRRCVHQIWATSPHCQTIARQSKSGWMREIAICGMLSSLVLRTLSRRCWRRVRPWTSSGTGGQSHCSGNTECTSDVVGCSGVWFDDRWFHREWVRWSRRSRVACDSTVLQGSHLRPQPCTVRSSVRSFAVLDEPEDDSPTGSEQVWGFRRQLAPFLTDPGWCWWAKESQWEMSFPVRQVRMLKIPISTEVGIQISKMGKMRWMIQCLKLWCPRPQSCRVAIDSGFRSLDSVTLETEFRTRNCLMRVVPKMMRGVFRTALRLSFQEVTQARAEGDVERGDTRMEVVFVRTANVVDQTSARWQGVQSQIGRALRHIRAWRVDSSDQDVQSGSWVRFSGANSPRQGKHWRAQQWQHKAMRGLWGSWQTLRVDQNCQEHPSHANSWNTILTNRWNCVVNCCWRTSVLHAVVQREDLRAWLARIFGWFWTQKATAKRSQRSHALSPLGKFLTRLWRPFGWDAWPRWGNQTEGSGALWSGISCVDWLPATLAQQFSKAILEATTPFQFALSTKAGTEAVIHALQALTTLDEDATVVSIDGVALPISFPAMPWFDGHEARREVVAIRPSVSRPTQPFTFVGGWLWDHPRHSTGRGAASKATLCRCSSEIQSGIAQEFHFCVRQVVRFWKDLRILGWHLFGVSPRVGGSCDIDIHSGKTKIWNRSGVTPTGVDRLIEEAQVHDPDAIVWRGDQDIPVSKQGMKVLGGAFGTGWIRSTVPGEKKSEHHDVRAGLLVVVVFLRCHPSKFLFTEREPRSCFRTTRRCTIVCARSWGWILMTSARVPFSSPPSHSTLEVWGLLARWEHGWFSGGRQSAARTLSGQPSWTDSVHGLTVVSQMPTRPRTDWSI